MAEPVSSIGTLLGILKTARDALRALRQAKLSTEHQTAVENALDQLADAQDRLSDIQAESIQLRDENESLRRQIADSASWADRLSEYQIAETEGGALVYKSTTQQPAHFACPACIEKERQIHILQDQRNLAGVYACPSCGAKYLVKQSKQVERKIRQSNWITRY